MTIYLIMGYEYEASNVVGAYRNRDEAEAEAKRLTADCERRSHYRSLRISVDTEPFFPPKGYTFTGDAWKQFVEDSRKKHIEKIQKEYPDFDPNENFDSIMDYYSVVDVELK